MNEQHEIRVRQATPADATGMAKVHVESWRETYRGVMPDDLLDAEDFVAWREHFWNAALTDPQYKENRVAVAERGEEIVGIAMSGPAPDADTQLYLIYLMQSAQGSGAGQALLDAVVDPSETTTLWVADPNPRTQAFYRRNHFQANGEAKEEDGVREIRMIRHPFHA